MHVNMPSLSPGLPPGLIIAAPASGCGKTVLTLALLQHWRTQGARVASAKMGPDYIDPRFHAAATGRPCVNLDMWAMRPETLTAAAAYAATGAERLVVEGVMGLFDGAADGRGATADLAALTGWPVLLVIDARAQGASAAALVHGFATWRRDVHIAGVVANRVGSSLHAELLRTALAPTGIPLLGTIPPQSALALPERHLGLVQAAEHPQLAEFLSAAALHVAQHSDTTTIGNLARPWRSSGTAATTATTTAANGADPPLGQVIAVADDVAFTFTYPHRLAAWQAAGATVRPFSPLANEAPDATADAVYLPGGYPELHAGRLALATRFRAGLHAAVARGALVYGECGGYMALGCGLEDQSGQRHAMAGLLPLETSFAAPRRHLGYRRATLACATPFGAAGSVWQGHEFHYACARHEDPRRALFHVQDARGNDLGTAGLVAGRVMGSFIHIIDQGPVTGR